MSGNTAFNPRAWAFGGEENIPVDTIQTQTVPEAFNPREWAFSDKTGQDIAGIGDQNAAKFNEQLAQFGNASPIQKYDAYKHYGEQMLQHYAKQGYTQEQLQHIADDYMKKANPTSDIEQTKDLLRRMYAGGFELTSNVINAFDTENVVKDWLDTNAKGLRREISDGTQIKQQLSEQEYQQDINNGMNEAIATLKMLYNNPMEIAGIAAEQVPQIAIGALMGGIGLGAVNAAAGAGRNRKTIQDSYEEAYKENPTRLLQLPEIQKRLAQGMSLEQAVNDAKTDVSDNIGSILAGAAIGGASAISPLGKIGKGINTGVMKTLGKEVALEAAQEAAEQILDNNTAGYIDGKTALMDNVQRNAIIGGVMGGAMGVPTAVDAHFNKKQLQQNNDLDVDKLLQGKSQSTTEQSTLKSQPQVNQANNEALETVLANIKATDEGKYQAYYDELMSDIQDGVLEQRVGQGGEYGRLVQAYLQQTGQFPQTNFTAEQQGNVQPTSETINQTQPESTTQNQSVAQNPSVLSDESFNKAGTLEQAKNTEPDLLTSRSAMKSVEANIKRGRERMTQAILDKADVKRGMYNQDFGWVDFVWGDDGLTKPYGRNGEPAGRGIAHIFEARERKDGQDYQQTTQMLVNDIVNTIAKGSITQRTASRLVLEYKENPADLGHRAILTKDKGYNGNAWILTAFEKDPQKGRRANSKDETKMGYDKLSPTHNTATLSRDDVGALEMPPKNDYSSVYASNVHQSTAKHNPQLTQDQTTLSRILGTETASHIEIVDSNTVMPNGKNVRQLHGNGVEGWFDPTSQKIYLVSDNISATDVLSRDERLAWVAWHELAHNGVRVKYADEFSQILNLAGKNVIVKTVASNITAEYRNNKDENGNPDPLNITEQQAIEEALVEIFTANQTNNWAEIESRYGRPIPNSWKQGTFANYLQRFTQMFKGLFSRVLKRSLLKTSDEQLFDILKGIEQGVNDIAKNNENSTASEEVSYSLREEADSDNHKGLQNILNLDKAYYWNKQKGSQLANVHGLQLPLKLHSDVNLSEHNIKTETDLSQYQSGNSADNVLYSRASLADYNQAKAEGKTELTFEQYQQVRTPEFKRWFGDWESDPENASKVVNPRTGEPLVVYHGTGADFTVFEHGNRGYDPQESDGYFFSDSIEAAEAYIENGGEIMSVFLNIRELFSLYEPADVSTLNEAIENNEVTDEIYGVSPPLLDAQENVWDAIIEEAEQISRNIQELPNHMMNAILRWVREEQGNDGVLLSDATRDTGEHQSFVVFNPNQIKSATDNNGEFSSENDDIRYSRKPTHRPKSDSLEKLRKAESIRISGNDIEPSTDLKQYKRNALNYGKTLRGTYVNKDTGQEIDLGLKAVKEVLSHDYKDPDHLQSIAAIPQIIENAVYIDTIQNEDKAKNPNVENYDYYLAGLQIGNDDYTVRAVVANSRHGEHYYDHKLSEIEKGELLSVAGITTPSSESKNSPYKGELLSLAGRMQTAERTEENSPLSEINDKRLLQILQDENADIAEDNIRYSRKQSVEDLAKTGKAKDDSTTVMRDMLNRDVSALKAKFDSRMAKLDTALADSLRPVSDWIDNLPTVPEHIKARLKGRMYRAKTLRNNVRSEIEQQHMKPIIKLLANLGKMHNKDALTTKRLVGFYGSLRYSIIKNEALLEKERLAMIEAEKALNEAKANGEDIEQLSRDYRKAERQYRYRKHDVELAVGDKAEFKVGTAGGWSIPEAKAYMANIEKHLPKKQMETVLKRLSVMQKALLKLDAESGRYTPEQIAEYMADEYYVPLTGDPNMEDVDNFIGGTGNRTLNISRDKALKGRKLSEAEDAFDAVWKAVGKTTTFYGWQPFKQTISDIYHARVDELQAGGLSEKSAKEQTEAELGISVRKMPGTTRSSDNVLIHKELGQYYEIDLPTDMVAILKDSDVEQAAAWTRWVSKPTRMMARGVTQFTYDFAPKNMLRDTWDKADMIRDKTIFDKDGKPLSQAVKDKIGREVWWNMANPNKGVWKATNKYARGQVLDPNSKNEAEKAMAEFVRYGGLSSFTQMIAHTESDFVKQVKSAGSRPKALFENLAGYVEAYNGTFDYVSGLATFKALTDNGVDAEQAASLVLDLANFNKTGSRMRDVKGFYMFLQPKMMGAAALLRSLNTKSGKKRFAAQFVASMVIYNALTMAFSALFGDDESGNKLDSLGDITGYIPIPIPWADKDSEHKFVKLHLGFGSAQLAWNMAANISRAARGSIPYFDAAVNIITNWGKVFAPVSPSEVSATQAPVAKAVLTFMPSLAQPVVQLGFNTNAFGSPIHTTFGNSDKLKVEQARANTATEWEALAQWVYDETGGLIDAYPESYKHMVEGYSLPLGSLREALNIFIENPNREKLGKTERPVFARSIVGNTNEFAVQRDFYLAVEDAKASSQAYERFKSNGKLAQWQTPEKMQEVRFYEWIDKEERRLRPEKSKRTRALNKKQLSEEAYDNWIKNVYTPATDALQRKAVYRWRTEHGLDSTKIR